MRPIGYIYKRVSLAPQSINAPHVADVYSLSNHISDSFADYINFWRHNGYWLFNSPATVRALAAEHSISLVGLTLFYFEALELQYDDESGNWAAFSAEPSFETNFLWPDSRTLEGFDVTTFSTGTTPECSPLSCNGVAADVSTNLHCLFTTFEAALRALEEGRFRNTEPGPYRIIGVYSVDGV